MNKIDDWRRKIDEIDEKLVELLNERFRCVIEIGRIKHDLKMQVHDVDREREVIRRVCERNQGPLDDEALERLFQRVFDESRRVERSTAVRGSESETDT